MYSASANFAAEIMRPHTPISKVEIKKRGRIYASTESNLYLIDGSVKVDRTATVRRTASLTFVDVDGSRTPLRGAPDSTDLFAPHNIYEFDISRGVQYQDGSVEYIPQGLFNIKSISIKPNQEGGYTLLDLNLEDRSGIPNRKPFNKPWTHGNSVPTLLCIDSIYDSYPAHIQKEFEYGWLVLGSEAGGKHWIPVVPAGRYKYGVGDNPWGAAQQIAQDIGFEYYFGRLGEPKLERIINPEVQQVVRVFRDDQYSVFTNPPNRELTLDDVCTGVICEGSAPWLIYPVRAEIWDVDPRSVSYAGAVGAASYNYYGESPLGKIPYILQSNNATNVAAATKIAQAEFYKRVGMVESITFDALPDPRLDVGDVIGLEESTSGTSSRVVLDSLTIPLRADGVMTGTTHRRRRTA